MSSPHDDGYFSPSPEHHPRLDDLPPPRISIPRRTTSDLDSPDLYNSPRRSPTLVRFDRTDPDVQERQRTMDVDSAMQLSRARSGSVQAASRPSGPSASSSLSASSSPNVPRLMSYRPSQPVDFPVLSEAEEQELSRIRDEYPNMVPEDALDEGDGNPGVGPSGQLILDEPEDRHSLEHSRMLMSDDPMNMSMMVQGLDVSQLGPLPMYQAEPEVSGPSGLVPGGGAGGMIGGAYVRSNFDFGPMEGFAGEERQRLEESRTPGLTPHFLHDLPPSASAPPPPILNGLLPDGLELPQGQQQGGETFLHRRQRRLSQSAPTFRRQAKLASAQAMAAAAAQHQGPDLSGAYHSADDLLGTGVSGGAGGGPLGRGHDRPYRFSFYSNALPAVIHARSLSELPAEGQSFDDLFSGRAREAPEPSSAPGASSTAVGGNGNGGSSLPRRSGSGSALSAMSAENTVSGKPKESLLAKVASAATTGVNRSREASVGPSKAGTINEQPLPVQDENHTWWLDVLCPTDEEMHMLSKVFQIHPLTTEDILMEETREKIELFRNYYLVCFRSFDQDPFSPTHLEPLNMYIIVFREGTLSFHFRGTPHPSNVRRRIKQLKDYISVTSDWISYALIDDITDAFGPLIQGIEYEVDSIDELVLILKQAEQSDMLRRIGTCRKKVMGLLRLMGNKADVVKGLAKRCNEQWSVAPKSDIGLYLSDIQDHLITMTQNLNHYEKILSRSHSNYLAQISIDMTDANNQINDVLSKLTALGTVLIPMNLITGLWGMNVHVPGQDIQEGYTWFVSIVGGLLAFAIAGAYLTYKLMVNR